jgi:hypothetical protein
MGCSLVIERPFRIGKALGSNPNISIFISSVFQNLFQKLKECSLDCKTKEKSECRGCSSVVEHPFRIGKALGLNPNISIFISYVFQNFFQKPKECSFDFKTKARCECRRCSSVVERPFHIGKALGLNPANSILISTVFQTLFQNPKECSLDFKTKERHECRGCSSVVEHPFCIGKALGSNPNISIFISSVFENLFQKHKECSLDCKTKERSESRGCSSVVERPFRTGKALGSNPNISIFVFQNLFQKPKECSLDCKTKDK